MRIGAYGDEKSFMISYVPNNEEDGFTISIHRQFPDMNKVWVQKRGLPTRSDLLPFDKIASTPIDFDFSFLAPTEEYNAVYVGGFAAAAARDLSWAFASLHGKLLCTVGNWDDILVILAMDKLSA